MKYLKYTSWLFLVVALVLIIDGIVKLRDPQADHVLGFAFAAVFIFMFFFRRNMAKRFENHRR